MLRFLKKHQLLLAILLLAVVLRCYRFNNPVLDWHSFRQADTASVTREYIKHGIDVLHPHYQDLSNIQSGKENLAGYRMVEFPIFNVLIALIVRTIPLISQEAASRIASIFFSIGTLLSLFYLVEKISGKKIAYATAIVGACTPYFVYYSRVIMPEPMMLFSLTFSLATFYMWLSHKKFGFYCISLFFSILAFLLKPFVIFVLPVFAVIAWVVQGKKVFKNILLYPFPILSLLPLLWWRHWIIQFPSGIPANDWLFNGDHIRFRPAWFRWLFWERLIKLIAGYTGVIFYFASLYTLKRNEILVYGTWWLGIIAYFSVIATGNVKHDYYQVLAVPIILITLGRGLVVVQELLAQKCSHKSSYLITGFIYFTALYFAWQQVGGYFNVNHWEYLEAGKAVDQLVPKDAKVIAPAFGDTNFLYQTNRTGWPIGFSIDEKIEFGAQYYITTSYDDEARELESTYTTVSKTPKYLLLDLTKKSNKLKG
ncbi:glycosyltransferase family 39 protein [Candidatus Woesebacteria bacterium]|nr:glycosyltransferase family 39 protein [Candidatus Woesebacteria bacterium]